MPEDDLFTRADSNHDGRLNREEVATLLRQRLGNTKEEMLQVYVDNFLKRAGVNADGHVERHKFEMWLRNQQLALKRLFDELRAQDEHITSEALQNALSSKAGYKVSLHHAAAILRRMDANKDGRVTFPELADSLLLVYHEDSDMSELFEYFDILEYNAAPTVADTGRFKSFLAGALAGSISRTVVAPLERVRVLMNTMTTRDPNFLKDFGTAIRSIYKDGGIKGFWRGNMVNVMRIAPSSATTFGVFDVAKQYFQKLEGKDASELSHFSRFLSGGIAGFTASTLTYPIELIQVVMMANIKTDSPNPVSSPPDGMDHKRQYSTLANRTSAKSLRGYSTGSLPSKTRKSLIVDAVKTIRSENKGVRTLYRGWLPSSLGIFLYSSLNLSTFETLKHTYLKLRSDETHVPSHVVMVIGAISTSTAASLVYPLSCVRTRMQAQGTLAHPHRYDGMRDCFRKTFAREGMRGFYRGLPASLAKAIPGASLSFTLVEKFKRMLYA